MTRAGKLHEDVEQEWSIWRLVFENIATLDELETTWNLDDVARANALLDMRFDLEEQQRKAQRNRKS